MIDLFNTEEVGHDIGRYRVDGDYRDSGNGGLNGSSVGASVTMESLLAELSSLARLMSDAVRDPNTNRLVQGVSLREVRETATVSRDLLNVVARNQELLAKNHSISIIQTAIVEALKELDAEGRNRFLEEFDRQVELLTLRAKAA